MEWFNPFEGGGTGGGGSSADYATSLVLELNSSTYVLTATLKNKNGDTLGTPQTIDLPLETMVVSGRYDSENKNLVLVLDNGQEITIPIGDLISGLQTEITVDNKLSIDLISGVGTAAKKNIPVSGNAAIDEVVMGNDTRLTDSRPASDVSEWAKAITKPVYSYNEITNKPTINGVTLSGNKTSADLGMVSAENGKGLSTNDYTNADKAVVETIDDKYPKTWDIELTQQEYDILPDTKYSDGKNYYIIDGDDEGGGSEVVDAVFYDGFSTSNNELIGNVAPCMVDANTSGTVQTVKLNIATIGTLSIGTIDKTEVATGASLDPTKVKVHEVMTFTQTGENIYTLDTPMEIKSNDYMVLYMPSDTAKFKYGYYGTDKGFFYVGSAAHVVTFLAWSIGVKFSGVKTIEKNASTYKGKTLSILGDSISTFSGYIPSGNATYYPRNDVQSVNNTWWKKLIDALGMTLNVNNSWSGSYVTTVNGATSAGCGTRAEALGESPDVIIVWMGINDFGNEVGLGTYDGTTAVPATTTTFREAYAIMLNKILTKYKTSEVWVCTLPQCERNGETGFPEINGNGVALAAFNKAICELAEAFGVKVLDHNRCGLNYQNISVYESDSLHPNKSGHSLIANNDIRQMDNYIRKRYV